MIKNARRGVTDVEQHLIQRTVLAVIFHEPAQALGITERRQGAIDCTNDLTQEYLVGCTPQPIPAIRTA